MVYIKQKETNNNFFLDKIYNFFGKIELKEFEKGYVMNIYAPIKEKRINLFINKIKRRIKKAKIENVVFAKNWDNIEFYKKIKFALDEYQIFTGKKLMYDMCYKILQYILSIQKTELPKEDIYFLIKKDKNMDLQFLSKFIENARTVNVITDDLERFKNIQQNIYENYNILISVSNNKTKSLKRAKYILNMNMDEKDLKKFKINSNAIIINFKKDIKYNPVFFNGINVNYFQINIPDEYIETLENMIEIKKFELPALYESVSYKDIEDIKITGLIGNNGKICETEFIQNYKKTIQNCI